MVVLEQLVYVRVLVNARLPEGCKGGHCFGSIHSFTSYQPVRKHVACMHDLVVKIEGCYLPTPGGITFTEL